MHSTVIKLIGTGIVSGSERFIGISLGRFSLDNTTLCAQMFVASYSLTLTRLLDSSTS
jgi:hypothetical protein